MSNYSDCVLVPEDHQMTHNNAVRLNTSFVDTDGGLKLLFCSCVAFTTQAVLMLCTSKKLLHVHKKIKRSAEAPTLASLTQPVGSLTKKEKGERYFTVPLWWTVTKNIYSCNIMQELVLVELWHPYNFRLQFTSTPLSYIWTAAQMHLL